MRILWSLPVRGARVAWTRGDLVRAGALVEALQHAGHDVRVVTEGRPADIAVAAFRRFAGSRRPTWVRVARDLGRWAHGISHARRVARAARAHRADLIVETQVGFACSGGLAACRTGLPLLLDDCSPTSEETTLGAGVPRLARRVLRAQAARALKVIAVSRAAAQALASEGIPRARLEIVPNGVDLVKYEAAVQAGARTRMRALLGFGVGDLVIVYAGSFQEWHRVQVLVAVLARLPRRIPARLLLIGDGAGRAAALAEARRCRIEDRVTDVGAVPGSAVPELLVACDVGVLPGSNHYGHPMKLLEYAAAGLACVAPDLPTVREVLQPHTTGRLFAPHDEEALRQAMVDVLDDPVGGRHLGEAARELVARPASWDRRAGQLLEAAGCRLQPTVRAELKERATGSRSRPVPTGCSSGGAAKAPLRRSAG